MSALFASTLFLSALLLFWVEPMMARMVLPLLGGTPAVWNTCVLFFQVLLLAGYAYAYVLDTRLTAAKQAAVHLLILGLAILTLPIGVAQSALRFLPVNANPVFWLLGCLLLSAGLPFLALSANAPLLQRWFSRTGRGEARDPYFLYAASNLGSLCALLAYPLLVEPQLGLIEQSRFWKTGFGLLIGFIVGCGVAVQRSGPAAVALNYAPHREHPSIPGQQRGRWLLLAFAPSSLMLGVTTYLATDIASIPLLWVLPLAIYLWTFILAFASRELLPSRWVLRAVPIGAIALVYMLLSEATRPAWLLIALHLLVFFLASLACHQQLAASRPPTHHLTEFYVWVAIGGALGGFFNALLAPLLFTAVAEYPIALLTACLLRPAQDKRSHWPADAVFAAGLAGLTLLLSVTVSNWDTLSISMRLGISLGVPLLACFLAVDRPFRFAAGLGAVLVVAYL